MTVENTKPKQLQSQAGINGVTYSFLQTNEERSYTQSRRLPWKRYGVTQTKTINS